MAYLRYIQSLTTSYSNKSSVCNLRTVIVRAFTLSPSVLKYLNFYCTRKMKQSCSFLKLPKTCHLGANQQGYGFLSGYNLVMVMYCEHIFSTSELSALYIIYLATSSNLVKKKKDVN